MHKNDFLYGSRSGIQKAIRRGDLDLLVTCFEALWSDSMHRNWLKWRTTVLVEEDAWQMIGELAKMLAKIEGANTVEQKKAYKRFLTELALAHKSKDTEALWLMATEIQPVEQEGEHAELQEMRLWLSRSEEPTEVANDLSRRIETDYRDLSKYEKAAVEVLRRRAGQGGMLGDRWACVACMILIVLRGLDEADVQRDVEKGLKRWLAEKGRKPKEYTQETLPKEYLPVMFDSHTAAGKMAISVYMKNKGHKFKWLTKENLADIWFIFQGAWVPEEMVTYHTKLKEEPTAFDTIWWTPFVQFYLAKTGLKPMAVKKAWVDKIAPELANVVSWCLKVREEREK